MPPAQPDPADHYFSAAPTGASARRSIELVLPEGRLIPLVTDAGVFSADKVDAGTRVLLTEGPAVPPTGVLADVGCGYGAIAVALALRAPEGEVWAVDVNERARALCRLNADANGVGDRVRVVAPDEVPTDLVVDQLWSNPPIRIGKAPLHDLLRSWLVRLRPVSGSATLVVQKHLGADSLVRWLEAEGWPTQRLVSRAGYRILAVSPSTSTAATGAPTTGAPKTGATPASDAATSEIPSAEVPTADLTTDEVPTAEVPTDEVPTDEVPTGEVPTDEVPS
ncbi:MAG: methyltransferase small [Actinomycetia bacterium]|nr:methyltransferase small [Actinomycetes bacterium]